MLLDGENSAGLHQPHEGSQIDISRVALPRPVVKGAGDENEIDRAGRVRCFGPKSKAE